MAYVNLTIHSGDDRVDQLIKRTIEPYLVEAHYLLAATRPPALPHGHFALSCTVTLLATIAATSALPNFERDGKKRTNDKKSFVECLRKYFPWESITVEDDQHRSDDQLIHDAAIIIYEALRCPLFHSGGLVGSLNMGIRLVKLHPGDPDICVAEKRVEVLANELTLSKQVVLKLTFRRCTLYVDWFYWCVRKLVERFAADPENVKLILNRSANARILQDHNR